MSKGFTQDFTLRVRREFGVDVCTSRAIVNTWFKLATEHLQAGGYIQLRGIGVLKVKNRRSPKFGSIRVIKFKVKPSIKNSIKFSVDASVK